jgi:hypothetical protein
LSQRLAVIELGGFSDILPSMTAPTIDKLGSFMIKTLVSKSRNGIDYVQESMLDEIRTIIDSTLGYDQDSWKEIRLSELMPKIMARTSARVITGKSLSRNKNLMNSCERCSFWIELRSVIIGSYSPPFIRTILSCLIHYPMSYMFNNCINSLIPLIEQRRHCIENWQSKAISAVEPPESWLTWSIMASLAGKYGDVITPKQMAEIMMAMVCSRLNINP